MKIVVHNKVDPTIGIVLKQFSRDLNTGAPLGFGGACTLCGWPMFKWNEELAVRAAQRHVDAHEPILVGGDTDALIR